MFRRLIGLIIPLLIVTACASAAAQPATSGLEGQVLIGPACPVMQLDTPCPDQPYQATITVLDAGGNRAAEFQSNAQGQFKIALAPGTYTLVPKAADGITRAGQLTVTVNAGQFTAAVITYDSGIR